MESRSSESRSGFGGYASESSLAGESRNSFRPKFSSESALESRPSSFFASESRQTSFSSESRETSGPSYGVLPESKKTYNSLEDIDKLIERLEVSLQNVQVTSEKATQILTQKKQKLETLKKLVAEARKAEAEKRMIQQLEQENSELDAAIDSMNKGFHR